MSLPRNIDWFSLVYRSSSSVTVLMLYSTTQYLPYTRENILPTPQNPPAVSFLIFMTFWTGRRAEPGYAKIEIDMQIAIVFNVDLTFEYRSMYVINRISPWCIFKGCGFTRKKATGSLLEETFRLPGSESAPPFYSLSNGILGNLKFWVPIGYS